MFSGGINLSELYIKALCGGSQAEGGQKGINGDANVTWGRLASH